MRSPIVVPDLGYSNLVLSVWYVKPGEPVIAGDRLVELLLGCATYEITAPVNGRLLEHCAWPDDQLAPGQVVGHLEIGPWSLDDGSSS